MCEKCGRSRQWPLALVGFGGTIRSHPFYRAREFFPFHVPERALLDLAANLLRHPRLALLYCLLLTRTTLPPALCPSVSCPWTGGLSLSSHLWG